MLASRPFPWLGMNRSLALHTESGPRNVGLLPKGRGGDILKQKAAATSQKDGKKEEE